MLFLVFLVTRRIINSPFGLSLRGIRENSVRMPALGAPSRAHLRKIYTISAVIAGIAGALLAQTTETVSLEVLGFQRSADVLVILILGGAGRLYGGLIGAIIFMVARDQFSGNTPQFWYFWIGMLLIVVVMFLPNGILGGLAKLTASWRTAGAHERGALHARARQELRLAGRRARTSNSALPQGARHALIGPNGAGKTTLINLMTGMLRPDAGEILLGDEPITALPPGQARQPRAGAHVPDQHAVSQSQRARSRDARGLRARRRVAHLVAARHRASRRGRRGARASSPR